jgi:hypothetical protein
VSRRLFAIAALVACHAAWAAGQERRTAPPIVVKTAIDRTAVWIGDPVVYTIEITCPPGSDILAADISRDRLKVANLDVVGATEQREAGSDGTIVYRARFRLVSFVTDGSRVGIEPQSVRYYVHTAGQPPESLVPADELHLPARTIAVRSSLPAGDVEWIRDEPAVATLPAAVRLLTPLGVAAIALTLVPVGIGVAGIVRRRRPWRVGRSPRRTMTEYRDALEHIRALEPVTDATVRRQAFDSLNTLVRNRLTDLGIPAHALSVDELERLMVGRASELPAAHIPAILRDCERAIYGRPEDLPGADAVGAALAETEALLGARTR